MDHRSLEVVQPTVHETARKRQICRTSERNQESKIKMKSKRMKKIRSKMKSKIRIPTPPGPSPVLSLNLALNPLPNHNLHRDLSLLSVLGNCRSEEEPRWHSPPPARTPIIGMFRILKEGVTHG